MKVDKEDYSPNVVAVNTLARQLQKASAKPNNTEALYRIATDIMIECQSIREATQQTKTIMDYIKRIMK